MTRFTAFLAALFLPLHNLLTRYMGSVGLIAYASPNTLTNLIPQLYAAADVVSRELVGFIPAVTRDSRIDRVAINQTVNVPVVGAITPVSISPAAFAPDTGGASPGNVTITISNQYAAPIAWNGDEQVAVGETGLYDSVMTQRFAQGMRAITNLVEADLAALYIATSRAYGTAGTQPFGTAGDFSDMAQVMKIMEDNGAPKGDMQGVFGTGAIANIRGKQSSLFKVNEAGTADMLRRGIIGDIMGVNLHSSAQIKTAVAVGTGASYTSSTAGFAVGATTIALITGTGTVLAGDVVTFAGQSHKYVVATALTGGNIVLAEPGLRTALAASAVAMTVVAAADRNMVFSKSAIVLATRTPYMPIGGDSAADVLDLVDPASGLTYQVAMYKQYRQTHFEIGLAWGVKMIAPRHAALLLG